MIKSFFVCGIARIRSFAIWLLLSLAVGTQAMAMRVSPMVSELSTGGAGAIARIEVGNVSARPLPFETKITRIDFDDNGDIQETPGDEDFVVFPPQGLVPPSGRQMVRVQWIGRPDIPTSQAYYLWVRQLPVETDPTKIGDTGASMSIELLYTMKSLMIVAPSGAKPDVEVVSLEPQAFQPVVPEIDPSLKAKDAVEPAPPGPVPGLKVTVSNKGNRYALMSGARWVLTATDTAGQSFERTYSKEEVGQIVGIGYLAPAGGKRSFSIPTGAAIDAGKPISLRFTQ